MMESIEKLRKALKACTKKAGIEPCKFDTYWITAKACDMLIDEIEAEIESRYMELPVDADGVPIHVGDVMEYDNPNDEDKPFTVLGVNNDGDVFHCLEDKRPVPTCISLANCLRHAKHDPLKELLEELANEVWEASCTCQTTWSDSGLDGIEERFAERIRELMEVDK